jgi:hypothetical protein
MTGLNQLFISYKSYIKSKYPERIKVFRAIEKNNPESARAEAVVHSLLESNEVEVTINENPSTGGADLSCENFGHKFLVEVTSFESSTVTKKSNIPDEDPDGIKAHVFSYITSLLQKKAIAKVEQLADEPHPRILAICSEHIANSVLFNKFATKELMTGNTKIKVELNKPSAPHKNITELESSVFIRKDSEGKIESCRRSISAILLVQVINDSCRVYGLLHPDPKVEFRYELLPRIPFIRFSTWPVKKNQIFCEWIIEDPDPYTSYYNEFKA